MPDPYTTPTSALEGGSIPTSGDTTRSSATDKASNASSQDLMNRVVQGAHSSIDKMAEKAAPHVERLSAGVRDAKESVGARSEDLTRLSEEWAESLRTTVREHPLAAVGTALALGLLVARLTR